MNVAFKKYIVKKTCKKCSGYVHVCGKPLIKGKIWKLPEGHPIVQKFAHSKPRVLLKLNDQTKEADG